MSMLGMRMFTESILTEDDMACWTIKAKKAKTAKATKKVAKKTSKKKK